MKKAIFLCCLIGSLITVSAAIWAVNEVKKPQIQLEVFEILEVERPDIVVTDMECEVYFDLIHSPNKAWTTVHTLSRDEHNNLCRACIDFDMEPNVLNVAYLVWYFDEYEECETQTHQEISSAIELNYPSFVKTDREHDMYNFLSNEQSDAKEIVLKLSSDECDYFRKICVEFGVEPTETNIAFLTWLSRIQ